MPEVGVVVVELFEAEKRKKKKRRGEVLGWHKRTQKNNNEKIGGACSSCNNRCQSHVVP